MVAVPCCPGRLRLPVASVDSLTYRRFHGQDSRATKLVVAVNKRKPQPAAGRPGLYATMPVLKTCRSQTVPPLPASVDLIDACSVTRRAGSRSASGRRGGTGDGGLRSGLGTAHASTPLLCHLL